MKHHHPRFSDTLVPLENTEYKYETTSISSEEGEFIWNLITEHRYHKTIEVGCALGISSLYICDALSQVSKSCHTIVDPYQRSDWAGIGLRNLQARGLKLFSLVEEPSELALPRLLEKKEAFDFGFIDGWHTFDQVLLDFYYLNRLIGVGGMIVFDDANFPSISKLLRYLSKYPAYKVVLPSKELPEASHFTLREQLFRLFCYGTKLIPQGLRNEIFSERVLSGQIRRKPISRIVGLMKIAEDKRDLDWHEPF